MDNINLNPQMQNPNVTPPTGGLGVPNQSTDTTTKKKSHLFLTVVLSLVAVGVFAWWYISQMSDEPVVVNPPKINQEAREDTQINAEIGGVDTGNLDAEFQAIDTDLNSL